MSLTPFEKTAQHRAVAVDSDAPVAAPVGPPPDGGGVRSNGEGPVPGRRRPIKWIPIALVLALLAGGLFWRSRQAPQTAGGPGGASGQRGGPGGGGPGGRGPQQTVVNTVPVTVGNMTQTLPLTGSLRSNQVVDLNSKIPGRVAAVYVNEGQRVTRGQLLIRLDDADLRAAVEGARAGLRTAEARLQQAIVGLPAREQQVGTSITQAQAALEQARARYQQALLQEPVTRSNAENQVRSAREGVRTAQARLTQARSTANQVELQTTAEVRQAEAGVGGAQAAVARAQATLAEVQRGARAQQVAQAQSAVNLAQANLRDAETELNRQRLLFQGGATARASVDSAQTRFDVARAQLESAQQQLSLVQEGATTEQVSQAQEAVRQAEEGVRQAQAQLSQARAGRIRATTEQGNITAALAGLGQAQNQLQTALSNLNQIPITRQETRTAQEGVQNAEALLSQARANRSQIPIARSEIPIARAGVEQARAQLRTAQVNLEYSRIYSPVNGVVNQKLTDVGETAAPGSALLNLLSLDRVYFEAQVPESSVRLVRTGQTATLTVPAVSMSPITGYVTDIIPVADLRLRQFRIRISIPNAPRELTPGAFARGSLVAQQVFNALIVPTGAVVEINGKPTVLVIVKNDDKSIVKFRVVQPGLVSGGRTQIIGGLRKGDLVIVDNPGLDDGEEVQLSKVPL